MQLNYEGLKDRDEWIRKGYTLPAFDVKAAAAAAKKEPVWVHFGAGNIFRAFHASLAQKLLDAGEMSCGITVAEGYDAEIIQKQYRPHDNLSILVTLKASGEMDKTVIGSVAGSCLLDPDEEKEFSRMREIFRAPSLQMATFTVTEKGYSLTDAKGELLPAVKADFAAGPERPASYIGRVTSLLYERFKAGALPVAMVSTDNCSRNGEKLQQAVIRFAGEWEREHLAGPGFAAYLEDADKVSFPWTMIDKITPRPDASVEEVLKKDGLEGLAPAVTEKKTWIAPFVNAEETEYLVIEDCFPNGRPPLEKAGVLFADRDTVNRVETMKVTTCLNPLHTALAVFGCLLGYERICDEMKDEDLLCLIRRIGYEEGLPVVVDPLVLDPKDFLDTVLNVRLPNLFMPDTPQRIATDTSQKLPIRYGETIRSYLKSDTLKVTDLKMIPLVQAGWLRYLMGINDRGEPFEISPDPMADALCPILRKVPFGTCPDSAAGPTVEDPAGEGSSGTGALLAPILHNAAIFGVDLYEAGLAPHVLEYFHEMTAGPGAVRRALRSHVHARRQDG